MHMVKHFASHKVLHKLEYGFCLELNKDSTNNVKL